MSLGFCCTVLMLGSAWPADGWMDDCMRGVGMYNAGILAGCWKVLEYQW